MARALAYKDINLIVAQDRRQKIAKEEKSASVRQPVLILILVLVALGAGYYLLYTQTGELEQEKSLLYYEINEPELLANYEKSKRLEDQAARMVAQKDELARVLFNLSSYPDMYGADFHLIYEYAGEKVGVTGVSFNRETGVLSFNAQSDTVTGVPIFVAQLRMSAIFADIRYEGYTEQVTTYNVTLAPTRTPRLDEFGNEVINPQTGEVVYDEVTNTKTVTEKSYIFAVTALVRAPEPHMP